MLERFITTNISDRPAFMQIVDRENSIALNTDYILQIDEENLFVSIIKLKKGGEKNMKTEIIRVPKLRMEAYVEEFRARIEIIEAEKAKAIEEAMQKVTSEIEAEYAKELDTLNSLILEATEEKEIEVKEEAVESVEEESIEEISEENVNSEIQTEQPVNQVF